MTKRQFWKSALCLVLMLALLCGSMGIGESPVTVAADGDSYATEESSGTPILTTESADSATVSVTKAENSVSVPVAATNDTATITVTEAEDTAAVNVTGAVEHTTVTVTVTEAADTATVTVAETADAATVTETTDTATVTVTETADAATVTVTETADTATVTVTETADTATVTISEAADAATITVTEAADTATVTVSEAADAATITVTETADTTTVTVSEAADTATITVTEAADTMTVTVTEALDTSTMTLMGIENDSAVTHSITYVLNGGSNHDENPSEYEEGTDAILNAPARAGYAFDGWFADEALSVPFEGITAEDCGDITVYAAWHRALYTVVFDGNGSSDSSYRQTFVCGEQSVLFSNRFSRNGYSFDGWNTEPDGSGSSYENAQGITDLCKEDGASVTLYAIWCPVFYKITYKLARGTAGDDNPVSYTVLDSVVFGEPDAPGYTLKGWYSDSKYKKAVTGLEIGTTGNITLYGKLAVNSYSVVFDGNGAVNTGSYLQNFSYETAKALTANRFVLAGYSFAGWNTEPDGSGTSYSNKQKVSKLCPDKDGIVILYAQWRINTYKITYKLASGTAGEENPASYTSFDSVTFAQPDCPGYDFGGWYSDAAFKKPISGISTGSSGNKTLYGKLTAHKYTVLFDGNGADNVSPYSQSFTCGSAAALTANRYKMSGMELAFWSTEPDGSGETYTDKQKVTNLTTENGATVTLYAQWRIPTYTITYKLAAGSAGENNPASYTAQDEFTFAAPDCTGYSFGGWYSDSKYKKPVTGISLGSTGNRTLYGKLSAIKYKVLFDGNGVSKPAAYSQSFTYGKAAKLTANKYSRKGYTFAGWNTEADESGVSYGNNVSVKNLTAENGAVVTLYAQWKPTTYKITYKLNGGTQNSENPASYTVLDSVSFAAPVRTGYTFLGWYSDSACKKSAGNISAGTTGNKTLYAKWGTNKYTVTFDGNCEGTSPYSQTFTCNAAAALKANRFTRSGYRFMGWNTRADGTGTSYTDKKSVKNLVTEANGSLTLYAQWQLTAYSISYKLSGGTNAEENPSSYTVYDAFTLNTPTREGYAFDGWYLDSSYKKSISRISSGSCGNLTLYAKWRANRFTVVLHANGPQKADIRQTVTVGKKAYLTKNPFSYARYTFVSWNTEADGSGDSFKNGCLISDYPAADGDVLDLYAQWTPNMVHITYAGLDYVVVNTKVGVEEFAKLTDGGICETAAGFGGRCLFVATYHCCCLYRGITDMNNTDAYYGRHDSISLRTRLYASKAELLKNLRTLLDSGKPQVVMAETSYGGARHFVTVVGYRSDVPEGQVLKETDLLIIDCQDGKLESMDPLLFSDKTRHLYSQEGKYRIETLY